MICSDSVIPSRNPMFHNIEIDLGDGRSDNDAFRVFIRKWVFISCFFIRMMSLGFGVGCVHVLQLRLL